MVARTSHDVIIAPCMDRRERNESVLAVEGRRCWWWEGRANGRPGQKSGLLRSRPPVDMLALVVLMTFQHDGELG